MIRFLQMSCLFFQAEDGIRDLVRSRGLGDVYKRQVLFFLFLFLLLLNLLTKLLHFLSRLLLLFLRTCLLYTSDAADERSSVDLGGRRIIKKKITADSAPSTLTLNHISLCNSLLILQMS